MPVEPEAVAVRVTLGRVSGVLVPVVVAAAEEEAEELTALVAETPTEEPAVELLPEAELVLEAEAEAETEADTELA